MLQQDLLSSCGHGSFRVCILVTISGQDLLLFAVDAAVMSGF